MDAWLKSGNLKTPEMAEKQKTADTATSSLSSCSEQISSSASTSKDFKEIKATSKRVRKFDDSFLKYGFTWTGNEDEPKAQCVMCQAVLSNESLKPNKLQRHLHTKHPETKDKTVDFFEKKLGHLKCRQNFMSTFSDANKKALEASYRVSYRIAKTGKPYTIAEELILPAAQDIVNIMFGEKEKQQLSQIPLSDTTVGRRIHEMADDIEKELILRIQRSKFYSLQLDESTDCVNAAQLICFIKYEYLGQILEDFFFCKPLQLRTTGEDIFKLIDSYVKENNILWENCVGVCSDGARAMIGKYSGLLARIKEIAPNVTWVHCIIHREALASKNLSEDLKLVLDTAVKIINFIKARPMNSRIFSKMCQEMGSEHQQLLLHTEVRWLSRGKILTRLFELKDEVFVFLSDFDKDKKFVDLLNDENWLCKLAYLSDIFFKLNELNTTLQGKKLNIFSANDKIESFKKKIILWCSYIKEMNFAAFPTLESFITEHKIKVTEPFLKNISEHLLGLKEQFDNYFSEDYSSFEWIRNPFQCNFPENFSLSMKEKLTDISSDGDLKHIFKELELSNFWLRVRNEYSELSDAALKLLMPFASSYMCEYGFSQYIYLKSKYRNRLNVEPQLRLKLSSIEPKITTLINKKQAQKSH